MERQRGASAMVALVVVAIAVLAGVYFFSDVFRTKADRMLRQFSEWTPENIAKDPLAYLDFAETQAKDATMKLKASEISVAQRRAKLEGMKAEADQKIKVGTAALDELKAKYKAAEAGSSWPVDWQGEKRSREFVRSQVVSLNSQVEGQKGLQGRIAAGLKQLEVQTVKISEQRTLVQEQLTKIATNREMLKVQQITDDIKNQLVGMRGVLESTVVAAGDTGSGPVSLDQLATSAETKVDDSKFDEIMAK